MSRSRATLPAARAQPSSGTVRRQARDTAARRPLPPSNQALNQALGTGVALPPAVRAEMEARLGEDFGRVRIHDQPASQQLAQSQAAQAFTLGEHIAFNQGRYAPASSQGKRLLAHELAHVVQQRRGGAAPPPWEGGPLEQAADHAAAAVAAGRPAAVAGASAVGIARQPLAEEEPASGLPPPRSRAGSLRKSEDALDDAALRLEIERIEAWLAYEPFTTQPERDHLAAELKQLMDEDLSRTTRRAKAAASKPTPKEGSVTALAGKVAKGRLEAEEVAAAHRIYRATGQVPQTATPFSWVEIKLGKLMSRAARYDLMVELQGQGQPLIGDINQDVRDPEFLTQEEFKQEFYERYYKERQACEDEYWRPGPKDRCMKAVEEKYAGPGIRAYREEQYRRAYAQYLQAQQKIEAVKSGGPVSLAGRAIGYGAGTIAGGDALKWSENFATVFSLGDARLAWRSMQSSRSQLPNYTTSGGFELRRDVPTTELLQSRAAATPPLTTGPAPTQTSGAQSSLPAPIPIGSGVGLAQSSASKALEANLARQSPEKAGSITPLPVRPPAQTPPPTEAAEQAVPVAQALETKLAVGQTHAPGVAAAPASKPALSILQGGQPPTVASAKKPGAKASPKAAAPVVTAKPMPTTAKASAKPSAPSAKPPAKPPAKRPSAAPAAAAPAAPYGPAEPMVAVQVQGGGSARKGTYVIEGTPEYDAAVKDKRFSIMPLGQAQALKFRPAGTPFDPAIEPLKVDGVQVESNAAGTGKGHKHNITARAGLQKTKKAREQTFGKTIQAAVTEAHGQKDLIGAKEVVILRPGNASTGGVDSITADVGRAATAGAPTPVPKVFLNDFTGPKTSKTAKATHADWVLELRDAVTHPRFGFGNAQYDEAVREAIQKGEVYVRTVRVEKTRQGIKVTRMPPRKVKVPAAVKNAVAKSRPPAQEKE